MNKLLNEVSKNLNSSIKEGKFICENKEVNFLFKDGFKIGTWCCTEHEKEVADFVKSEFDRLGLKYY